MQLGSQPFTGTAPRNEWAIPGEDVSAPLIWPAGVEISLRIGQRVRHQDFQGKRVTGVVRGLSVDSDRVLHADIVLDEAIVIPARRDDDRDISIWHQHVPAHELAPFDEREELIAGMLEALRAAEAVLGRQKWLAGSTDPEAVALFKLRAAIAKATGSAA